MSVRSIYRLGQIEDRYTPLLQVPMERVDSVKGGPRAAREYEVRRLADGWTPLEAVGPVSPNTRFTFVNGFVPAFSAEAAEALADLLLPNGELLPVTVGGRAFYCYNTTTVADVLDAARSEIAWIVEPQIAFKIHRHEFRPERLDGLVIFRIIERTTSVFVTGEFVRRSVEEELAAASFVRVWQAAGEDAPALVQVPRKRGGTGRRR